MQKSLKVGLIISLVVNAIAISLWQLGSWTIRTERAEFERVEKIRLKDFLTLEHLLTDRISRSEVLKVLNEKLDAKEFFTKPPESGIGAGSMYFLFGLDDNMKQIEINRFQEK